MLIDTLIPYFDASHLLHSYSSFKRIDGLNLMESVMVCSKSPAARAAAARSLGASPELVLSNNGGAA
jgi:hypothetical protein